MTTVDRIRGSLSSTAVKAPVRVATTANITLSGEQTIDGIAVVADDRVLVKDQTTTTENGIYIAATGTWARAADWDDERDVITGTQVLVNYGTTNADTRWKVSTADPIVPGTTSVSFAALGVGVAGPTGATGAAGATGPTGPTGPAGASGAGTGDMLAANNLSDVASTVTALANLGIGDLGVLDTVGSSQIDNDAVTYAKMQNVSATSRILGRKTSGAGDTEELTISEAIDFIGSAANGDILYRTGGAWTRLAKGTASQVLTMNAGATAPEWAAAAAGASWVKISEVTPSGASTVDFTSISSTYLDLMITYYLVPSSGGASLLLRTYGVDTALDSGSSDYQSNLIYPLALALAPAYAGTVYPIMTWDDSTDSSITVAANIQNSDSNGEGVSGFLIATHVQASLATHFAGQASVVTDTSTTQVSGPQSFAGWRREKAAITGIRLFASSGTLTGRVLLWGRTAA